METRPTMQGIWPVLVTPFTADLKIDIPAYHKILEWHLSHSCHGLYTMCLSSEMFLLDQSEQKVLVEEAVRVTAGAVPIAATGNVDQDVDGQIEFIAWAADAGADVVMLVIPEHLDDEDAIEHYFMHVVERTEGVALGLYECPQPQHKLLSPQLVNRLAQTGRFKAYKETSCNILTIKEKLAAVKGTPLSILQANIPYLLDALQAGCPGSMNVVANWLPDLTVEVFRYFKSRDLEMANYLHEILCTFEMMQRSIHPSGVKYLMSLRGLPISPRTRLPKKLTPEERKSIDLFARRWLAEDGAMLVYDLSREAI